MKTYRIFLIRHGKTNGNLYGKYIGVTDLPLCMEGAEELAALRLHHPDGKEYPEVHHVYASPLTRCLQSAQILYPGKEVQPVQGLCEYDFGEFEGKSADELIQRDDYKLWLRGGADSRPPEGESMGEFTERCVRGLEEVLLDMMRRDITRCAVVTHAGVIMNLLAGCGLPKAPPFSHTCGFGEGYEIMMTAQLWQRGRVFEILGKIPD